MQYISSFNPNTAVSLPNTVHDQCLDTQYHNYGMHGFLPSPCQTTHPSISQVTWFAFASPFYDPKLGRRKPSKEGISHRALTLLLLQRRKPSKRRVKIRFGKPHSAAVELGLSLRSHAGTFGPTTDEGEGLPSLA
uniref:Uncharacterized protein n=1 Tax=Pyxicephalus adspersus TaxID=30357 RepID=A0AAV3B471_PYXAD|nr:TPA: hypothetical protein GDO54_006021 [Pyxicephalus adspersus]